MELKNNIGRDKNTMIKKSLKTNIVEVKNLKRFLKNPIKE